MEVGFVGLGDQGAPMADAIMEGGHRLHLWARRPEVLEPYAARGAIIYSDPSSLAAAVQHLGICVVAEQDVRELLYTRGMMAEMRPGSLIAIHTTMAPGPCREMATDAAARSVALLDAPVSGGKEGAIARRLLLLAGGDVNDVRSATPVFSCYASRICHVGQTGAGQTAKILNNLLLNANLAASHFVLRYGESLGISRAMLREVMLKGTAASTALDWLDRVIIPGNHPATLGRKDIALALDLAVDVPPEIAAIAASAIAGRNILAGLI